MPDQYDYSDPSLLGSCETEKQRAYLTCVNKSESINTAAKVLGVNPRGLHRVLETIRKNHAKRNFDLGSVNVQSADGFQFGKVTTQRKPHYQCPECGHQDPERIERIWDRQTPEPVDRIIECLENHEPKPRPAIPAPKKKFKSNLINLFTITDFHLGMYAWEAECGEAWDTHIAGQVYFNAIRRMHEVSPPAETALLNIQGDFMHWDGLEAVTPTNQHVLDADTRLGRMIDLAMDMVDWSIEFLLEHYKKVHVVIVEGNHDLSSSKWLQKHCTRMFRKNRRVTVDDSEFPYYAHLFGKTLIGIHHGHKVKNAKLPSLYSEEPRFRSLWGQALYTFIHTGHMHHESMQISENGGALVVRHPTLAARDAHAVRGGWNSQRGAYVFTYNDKGEEVCRHRVTPEAL